MSWKWIPLRGIVVLVMLICLDLLYSSQLLALELPSHAPGASVAKVPELPLGQDFALPDGLAGPVPLPAPAIQDTDRLIVKYRESASHRAHASGSSQAQALSMRAGANLKHHRTMSGRAQVFRLPKRMKHEEVQAMARKLAEDPEVEYAVPDLIMSPMLVPNDLSYPSQWHYKSPGNDGEVAGVNLPGAWDFSTGSANVVVGVIDTGIVNHADLQGRILPGYNFISDPQMAGNGIGRSADASDLGDWTTNSDGSLYRASSWHGTHVAGTIAATTNNGGGVAGINWNAKILPVRVLGKGGGYVSDIVDGMRWAAGLPVPGVPANPHPAQVINMSLGGGGGCDVSTQQAVDELVAAGTVVVVAAGNDGGDAALDYPAACVGVIPVASVNRAGGAAYYTNRGSVVKLAAPGGEMVTSGDPNGVLSTLNTGTTSPTASPAGDSYAYYQGTSMAAPHVTGVVSLLFSVQPGLTPAQVLGVLEATARPFPTGTGSRGGDCSVYRCGAGIVDAYQALRAVSLDLPVIGAEPYGLLFSTRPGEPSPPNQIFDIVNRGGGVLNWTVSTSTPWLHVNQTSGQGDGSIRVSVDNTGLSTANSYTGYLVITANGAAISPVTVPVTFKYRLRQYAPVPVPVAGPIMATLGSKIYLIGGGTVDQSATSQVQIYDTVTDSWSTGAPKPTASRSTGAAVINGKIYVPGGSTGSKQSTLEIYDPAANQWSTGASLPLHLAYASVQAVNGKLYVLGGSSDFAYAARSTYVYDPATNSWSTRADMKTGRTCGGSSVLNGKIYVYGGVNAQIAVTTSTTEIYDPATNTWTAGGALKRGRYCLGSASLDGTSYAIGGAYGFGQWTVLDDSESYLPDAGSWSEPPFLVNEPRYNSSAVTVGSSIYLMGGYTKDASISNLNESYSIWGVPVNGVCGSSNGKTSSVAPTSELCTTGWASAVTADNGSWNWSCAGANGGTSAACSAPSLPVITTTSLPNALVGYGYSATLSVSGGKPPYSWSTSSGYVVPGLDLNPSTGVIAGTPPFTNSNGFTAHVTDAAGSSASKYFSITAKLPPAMLARTPAKYYTLLQDAYNACANGETIKLSASDFSESPRFDRNLTVLLSGGFNDAFTASSGTTRINGKLSVYNGNVKLNGVTFR